MQLIGEGTYGQVIKAQHRKTGALVAIKRFKKSETGDANAKKTIAREVKVLSEYRHRNIVNLREAFRDNNKLNLVFDYEECNLLEEL